jgi:hypothetical protein
MTNPPAFPEHVSFHPLTDEPVFPSDYRTNGMTLRDYFAAKAMASLMSNLSYGAELQRIFDPNKTVANSGPMDEGPCSYLCRLAYAFADAMLTERAKS